MGGREACAYSSGTARPQSRPQSRPVAELLVLDPAVPDAAALLASARPCRVARLTAAGGSDPVGAALAAAGPVAALHLVSHGAPGQLTIAGETLDAAALARFGRRWRRHLAPRATVVLYGCEAGRGRAGRALVRGLARATGARVVASSTPTGSAARGGDWRLDVASAPAARGGAPANVFGPGRAAWTGLLGNNFSNIGADQLGLADIGNFAHPALVDIDGDGDQDAFIGTTDGTLRYFRNDGSSTSPSFNNVGANQFGFVDLGDNVAPAFADLDGDGDLDALVTERFGETHYFRNDGTTTAPNFTNVGVNTFGISDVGDYASIAIADIDGDGDLDVFKGATNGQTTYFRNDGTASAPNFTNVGVDQFGLADVGFIATPELVDIDVDGDLDMFVGNQTGNLRYFRNDGTSSVPNFSDQGNDPFGLADVGDRVNVAFVDIDGDGDYDAFVGDLSGSTFFFRNINAAPTVANAITNQTANSSVAYSFQFAADTFNDADSDALTYSSTGLPAGLSFDAATRTFSGTLSAGVYTVTVRATDTVGGTVTTTYQLTVAAPGTSEPGLEIVGSGDDDRLIGSNSADTLSGGSSDDTLIGLGGNDVQSAGGGADQLFGDDGQDMQFAGAGNDAVHGGQHADLAYGNQGSDIVYGNQGADTLYGGQDADTIFGGQDADLAYGNLGADSLDGGLGADTLYGGQGADTLRGGDGGDRLFAGDDDDLVGGGAGDDVAHGGGGNDVLLGGSGNDTLSGAAGNDTLTGGDGADRFVLLAGEGADVILDFDAAEGDVVQLQAGTTVTATLGPDGLILDFGDGTTVLLMGVQSVDAASYMFV